MIIEHPVGLHDTGDVSELWETDMVQIITLILYYLHVKSEWSYWNKLEVFKLAFALRLDRNADLNYLFIVIFQFLLKVQVAPWHNG